MQLFLRNFVGAGVPKKCPTFSTCKNLYLAHSIRFYRCLGKRPVVPAKATMKEKLCHLATLKRSFGTSARTYTQRRSDPLASKSRPTTAIGQAANLEIGGYFLLIIPISTFCLGVWQVYRWFWKLDLIATMEKAVSEIVPFNLVDFDNIDAYEYKTVTLKGTFTPGKELLLGPRSLHLRPTGSKKRESGGGGMMSHGSQSGYNIITPFTTSDAGVTILVNRGWVPSKHIEKYKLVPSGNSEVEISGVLRKAEKRAPLMGKNHPGSNIWLYRDIPSMAQILDTSEVFIDLISVNGDDSQNTSNFPVPGQTRVTLRNEHVSYFITWFSLSGLTSYMWFRRFFQGLPLK